MLLTTSANIKGASRVREDCNLPCFVSPSIEHFALFANFPFSAAVPLDKGIAVSFFRFFFQINNAK